MKKQNTFWAMLTVMLGSVLFLGCQPEGGGEEGGGSGPSPTDDYYGSIVGYWDVYTDEQTDGTYRYYNILNSDGTFQCLYAFIKKNGTLQEAGWLQDGNAYWKASKGKLTYWDNVSNVELYYRMYKDQYVLIYNSLSDDLEDYYTWWERVSKSDIAAYINKANETPEPPDDNGEPTGGKPQPTVG